jgi:hypothetical protein
VTIELLKDNGVMEMQVLKDQLGTYAFNKVIPDDNVVNERTNSADYQPEQERSRQVLTS